MFLDDTACNLASMNLLAFLAKDLGQGEPRIFDVEGYEHAVRLWTVVLEIAVLMAQFPSKQIALRSPTNSARSASATPMSAAC